MTRDKLLKQRDGLILKQKIRQPIIGEQIYIPTSLYVYREYKKKYRLYKRRR